MIRRLQRIKVQIKRIQNLQIMNADTIIYDGLIREYVLYVPEAYDSSSAVPLMLNFHGNGGSRKQAHLVHRHDGGS